MKTIESQYVATATTASAAVGASATIPAVRIPIAIGLGVADLLFFYETTALFAPSTAELRGTPIDDPERAKAVVLGAMLGEKRKSYVTELMLSAPPAGARVGGAISYYFGSSIVKACREGYSPRVNQWLASEHRPVVAVSSKRPALRGACGRSAGRGTVKGSVVTSRTGAYGSFRCRS